MNTTNSVNQRLSSLRDAMTTYNVAAYIVTNNDPHNSEYSADHWAGRTWISGFTRLGRQRCNYHSRRWIMDRWSLLHSSRRTASWYWTQPI